MSTARTSAAPARMEARVSAPRHAAPDPARARKPGWKLVIQAPARSADPAPANAALPAGTAPVADHIPPDRLRAAEQAARGADPQRAAPRQGSISAAAPVVPAARDPAPAPTEPAATSGQDAETALAEFQAAPPSVKAQHAAGLESRVAQAFAATQRAEDAAPLRFQATMSGDAAPQTSPVGLPTPPQASGFAPDPAPDLPPLPDLAREVAPDQAAPDAAPQLSVGARPQVPLAAGTDPARLADQAGAATAEAGARQAEAAHAVMAGPGPYSARLRGMSDAFTPPPAPALPAPGAQAPIEGADAFTALSLDAETTALFDRAHGPAMAQSLSGARAQLDRAAEDRRTGRAAAITEAEAGNARLNDQADQAQRDEVTARRGEIASAQQTALDRQADHLADLQDSAQTARDQARTGIGSEVSAAETRIDADYARAEAEAQSEITQGAARADAARDDTRRAAEDQGWADRARAQLDRLTQTITAIFDAVRAAVRAIMDRVQAAALALIDLTMRLISGIIAAYGALLKLLVTRLLADYFPAIAAALTAAIDRALAAANLALDRIAVALRAGMTLLMGALARALEAVLAGWQAASAAALALAHGALQGDWRALAELVLTPILMVLGIPPDAFFQLFDRAAQAKDLILANPGGFVANLLDAVKGGIHRFAENFRRHLIAGIILWLTGPLGRTITMPAEFDLWGLLDVARQALGLTIDTVRRVAVRVIGEKAVRKIEYVLSYVGALVSGGWQGLWQQLSSDLGMLRDMVLDQIRSFLVEKVVVASIMWLASIFNPVGALVKLVMTIWNFITFLRAQLSRIFAVAQTVINTIWEIATGALEPPIRGVEQVLGRMLPIVLDLLARLIGVGGIPEKVQEVLQAVRLRIETALEKLMRRVLEAMGIKAKDPEAPPPGQIMAPIPVSAGGESHTLLIEDQGETVRPVIRSDPTPLVQWLDERPGLPFTELAAQKNWRGVVLANKRAELLTLIAAARTEEARLDEKAEAAEDAINLAAAPDADAGVKAAAAAKAQDTQTQGQATKSALMRVLDFFGIRILPLDEKFTPELQAMPSALAENLRRYVLPQLDVARYTPLDWRGFGVMLPNDGSATEPWRYPANATGAARRFTGGGFDAAIATEAHRLAQAGGLANAETFLGPAPGFDRDRINTLFGDHLARRLNESGANAAIIAQLLAPGGPGYPALMAAISAPLLQAVTAMCSGGDDSHDHAFAQVTGSYFRERIVENFDSVMRDGSWGTYYHDDAMNAAGSGAGGVTRPLGHFVRPDPTGQAGSKRAARNGQRLADAVRGADPGKHEWIASRFAAQIIRNAAADVEQGQTERLRGLCELIQFQHHVRTPTRELIFDPIGPYPAQKVAIGYQAYGHRMNPDWQATPETALPADRKAEWYPAGAPHQGDRIEILQGHPGAIYARVSAGAPAPEIKMQSAGHGTWDQALENVVARDLADGTVYFNEMHELAENIVSFFRLTVWTGENLPPGSAAYGEYFNSAQSPEYVEELAAKYKAYFPNFETTLRGQVAQVRRS